MEKIKFIIILIPAIVVIIKTMDSLFIENIKLKYNKIPGKQESFGAILKVLGNLLIMLELIFLIYYIIMFIYNVFINGIFFENFNISNIFINKSNNESWIYIFIGLSLAIIFMINIILAVYLYTNIGEDFIMKLEGEKLSKAKRKKGDRYIKSLKIKLIINWGLSYFNLAVYIIIMFATYIQSVKHEISLFKEDNIGFLMFMLLFSLTMAIVANSLKRVFDEIFNNIYFKFLDNNDKEIISCDLYIEYSDSYLIINKNEKIFLSKNSIKLIKKIELI